MWKLRDESELMDRLSYKCETDCFDINELTRITGDINGVKIWGPYMSWIIDDKLSTYDVCRGDTISRIADIDDDCCLLSTSKADHRVYYKKTIRERAIGHTDDVDYLTDEIIDKYMKYKKGKRLWENEN